MTVSSFRIGTLTIAVGQDAQLQQALQRYDANTDGIVDRRDFPSPIEAHSQQQLFMAIVDCYVTVGQITSNAQHRALHRFFSLYDQITLFDAKTTLWDQHKSTSWFGDELEYSRSFWTQEIMPWLQPGGQLAAAVLDQLPIDILIMLRGFEGTFVQETDYAGGFTGAGCLKSIVTGATYNRDSIPPSLREAVATLADRYVRSAAWLYGYRQIEVQGLTKLPPFRQLGLNVRAHLPTITAVTGKAGETFSGSPKSCLAPEPASYP